MNFKFFFIILLIFPTIIQPQNRKKKLYLADIWVSKKAKNIASDIHEEIKQNVLVKYGEYYHVLTDKDIKKIYKQNKEVQYSICSQEACRKKVAQFIGANEILYGHVIMSGKKLKANLKNLTYNKNKRSLNKKSKIVLKFSKKEYKAKLREITSQLIDPKKKLKSDFNMFLDELLDPTMSIDSQELKVVNNSESYGDSAFYGKNYENEYEESCFLYVFFCEPRGKLSTKGALEYYQEALENTLQIKDENVRKKKQDHLLKKLAITKKVGSSRITNSIELLIYRAMSLKGEDSYAILNKVKDKLVHSIFTTRNLVELYNIFSKKMYYDQILEQDFNYNNYGQFYTGKYVTNSIGMELVFIPAGIFDMGCSAIDSECDDDEKPRHRVKISKSFYISKYEVTKGNYEQFTNSTGYTKNFNKMDTSCIDNERNQNHPEICVSLDDAKEFAKWLSEKENKNYRLPTEAEWEYAARSFTSKPYYWGTKVDNKYVWYHVNSKKTINPVGQRLPNSFGLYDMLGNVWELVLDCYDNDFYKKSPKVDPINDIEEDKCRYKGVRGGSILTYTRRLRVSFRDYYYPYNEFDYYGFRLVFVPKSK